MSQQVRSSSQLFAVGAPHDVFAKAEQEISAGYVEVEITGITLKRLVAVYAVLFRGAWNYALDSVRAAVRPTPAIQ